MPRAMCNVGRQHGCQQHHRWLKKFSMFFRALLEKPEMLRLTVLWSQEMSLEICDKNFLSQFSINTLNSLLIMPIIKNRGVQGVLYPPLGSMKTKEFQISRWKSILCLHSINTTGTWGIYTTGIGFQIQLHGVKTQCRIN